MTQIQATRLTAGQWHNVPLSLPGAPGNSDAIMHAFVRRGRKDGPTLFITAAMHGDELNGLEIIRRFMRSRRLSSLQGTVIVVPVVNVHGFGMGSRYLPDRRDLNRVFPGSAKGSLAGRVAEVLMQEVVLQSDYGIDLHTAAIHRYNVPQIRAELDNPVVEGMATAFGVPLVLNSELREGSLREAAGQNRIPVIVYEAGEALRLDEISIKAGVRGIKNVMTHLGMISARRGSRLPGEQAVADSSYWERAGDSGVFQNLVKPGTYIKKDQLLARIISPSTMQANEVRASRAGILVGLTQMALVYEGDALFHIARYRGMHEDVASQVERFHEELGPDFGT
ncbi:MAG: succinylglutamate desuccinylase/aspartoacylase family protein [Saccharospirillum sp.]